VGHWRRKINGGEHFPRNFLPRPEVARPALTTTPPLVALQPGSAVEVQHDVHIVNRMAPTNKCLAQNNKSNTGQSD
jgi:hypothetical protein